MKVFGKFVNVFLVVILLFLGCKIVEGKMKGQPPTIFGHQMYYVLSGSMEPKLHTGSIIIVKKRTKNTVLSTGEIITFKMPYNEKILVTHRIKEIVHDDGQVFYRTKGDANPVQDPWVVDKQSVVSVYSGITIPVVGYFYKMIHTHNSIYGILLFVGLVLLFTGMNVFRKSDRKENNVKS